MGVWVSFLVHVVLVLLLVEVTRGGLWWEPEPLEGSGLDQGGGGGGPGREVTMIPLSPAPAAAVVVRPAPLVVPQPIPPAPVVTPDVIPPPTVVPPPADTVPPAATSGAVPTGAGGGTGGGSGGGAGPGTGPGTGPGSGGTGTGGGDTARVSGRPPEPRQLILPPFDYPKTMRGQTIQVTFFVLADGRVDHVVFGEDIPDRGYAKKLEDRMLAYRFRPARSPQGLPIPGHTTLSISF